MGGLVPTLALPAEPACLCCACCILACAASVASCEGVGGVAGFCTALEVAAGRGAEGVILLEAPPNDTFIFIPLPPPPIVPGAANFEEDSSAGTLEGVLVEKLEGVRAGLARFPAAAFFRYASASAGEKKPVGEEEAEEFCSGVDAGAGLDTGTVAEEGEKGEKSSLSLFVASC